MSRVPDALIRRLCYPSSYRLPKVERLMYPAPKDAPRIFSNFPVVRRGSVSTFYPERKALEEVQLGNLLNDEYRLFVGRATNVSTWGQCRWCDGHFRNFEARKNHLTSGKCKENLSELYRNVRVATKSKPMCCLVCDLQKDSLTWGIPICSISCANKWRFAMPDAFLFERTVMKQGGIDA